MTTIIEIIRPFLTFHEYLNYTPERCLFFDIETTGLSAAHSSVFLIGTIHLDTDGNWLLTQYLADSPEDEPKLLLTFLNDAQNYDTLIHFNGTTFDLPFVTERKKKYQIPHSLEQMQSLDLYQKLRPLKKLYHLDRMNQTSLEAFLGWDREDRLTGKHMISLYQTYIASGEQRIRDLLLLHNHDDMIGMTKLLGIFSVLLLMSGEFDTGSVQAVPETASESPDCQSAKDCCQIRFQLIHPLPVPLSLEKEIAPGMTLSLHAEHTFAALTVPLLRGELKYFFKDYRNYYYLPLEDQAIHKSVGAFVDKDLRMPAKPATCYIRKSGLFLPQPEALFAPVFQTCYEEKPLYFEYESHTLDNTGLLTAYAESLLKILCQ